MTFAETQSCGATTPDWHNGDVAVWSLFDGALRAEPDVLESSSPAPVRLHSVLPEEAFDIPVNLFLVVMGNRRILVDAGGGSWAYPTLGGAPAALRRLGHSCADIDLILMTHLHPDHVTGLIDATGESVFPQAELVIHEREIDFWLGSGPSTMSERTRRNAALAKRACDPYSGRIHAIEAGAETNGLTAVDLPGHTPGHTGWRLSAGRAALLFWGDIVHAAETQLRLPDTAVSFDVDKAAARETRRRILSLLADGDGTVAGAHLPRGGIGTLARDGDGFRFVPVLQADSSG